jgi:glycerol kinase
VLLGVDMSRYILAIDQGTTGSTALIIDESMQVLGRANHEFPQIYPQPGWVEHEPQAILNSVQKAIRDALVHAKINAQDIAGIGITNQRETIVLWDRESGEPVHNAIVWQCRRSSDQCARWKEAGHEEHVTATTGLRLDPYFSGSKMHWLLNHVDGAQAAAQQGNLIFGTIDTFLLWHLTGGQVHATDVSNASRTLLMNIHSCTWNEDMLALFEVPHQSLPEIRSNSEIYGHTKGFDSLPDGIPVAGMAGDQQAALFGQACFAPGEAKCTYGTGAFLLMNTGDQVVMSQHGLLSTVAWRLGEETTYALEGSAFIAGAAVQWLRDGLQIIESASDIEALAQSVESSDGVFFVPALTGLGAPYWDPDARGMICGLTRGVTRAHLARATLEGIAFQNEELLAAMQADSEQNLLALKVDGGASANHLLMQIQADLVDCQLLRPRMLDTTALGSGLMAGLAVGIWEGLEGIKAHWQVDATFNPQQDTDTVASMKSEWRKAVARSRS